MTLRAIDSFMLSGIVYLEDIFATECYCGHKHTFIQNFYYSGCVFPKEWGMYSHLSCSIRSGEKNVL